MSSKHSLDFKLLDVPTVLVQNLNIEMPPDEPVLSDLCKLPEVHIEKLNLEMIPRSTSSPIGLVPRVCLEKLDLKIIPNAEKTKSPLKNGMKTQGNPKRDILIPIVRLERCHVPEDIKRRATFNIPQVSHKYTLVGPYKNVQIKPCTVNITRDNFEKFSRLEKPSICKLCRKVYYSKKKLIYHHERKHDLVPAENPAKKKKVSFSNEVIVHTMPYHRCRKCLKIFETYKILKAHMRSQHRKRNKYICDYCKKLFADRTIFKIHIKLHCDVCTELFAEKKHLLQHKKTRCYSRVLRFKCIDCEDIYFSTLTLKDHSYSHQNKMCICDKCKEHYMTKCNMIRHLRTHENAKQIWPEYACEKIGPKRIYTCMFCSETFRNEKQMNEHLKMDDGLENNCGYCGLRFAEQSELIKHMWFHVDKSLSPLKESSVAQNTNAVSVTNETSKTSVVKQNGVKGVENVSKTKTPDKKKPENLHYCPFSRNKFNNIGIRVN